jgi:hypothetical protein
VGPGEANNLVTLQTDIHQHFFGAGQGWPTFLRARAKFADNFRRKLELTGTVFRAIAVTCWHSGSCPAGPAPSASPAFSPRW